MTNPFATAEMAVGYAAARPPVHPRIVEQYFAQRGEARVGLAVDLGCGAGLSTRAVQPYAAQVLGLEPVVMMVRLANRMVSGAMFAAAAGEALPLRDHSVDLITAAGSLNYVRDLDRCFDEMRRVLRQHGSLLVYDFGAGRRFDGLRSGHRREPQAIAQSMFALRMAAGEAGVFAYDGAFADIRDADGYRAEAELARRLGFLGKSCIHPSQVALANAVFRPSDEEIAHAVRVVEAARDADARGVGAYVVDGKMIDPPFVLRARALVASAERLGLLPR